MSESKSYLIFLATIMIAMYVYLGYRSYNETICKTELAKTTRAEFEINEICK